MSNLINGLIVWKHYCDVGSVYYRQVRDALTEITSIIEAIELPPEKVDSLHSSVQKLVLAEQSLNELMYSISLVAREIELAAKKELTVLEPKPGYN